MTSCILCARDLRRLSAFLLGGLIGAFLMGLSFAADEPKDPPPADRPAERKKPTVETRAVVVILADGSVVKLVLHQEKFVIGTEFGKLTIPVADVAKIEFATRISAEVTKQIRDNITKLGSAQFKEREQAAAELKKLGAVAHPALVDASKNSDAEVAHRAEELAGQIENSVPPEDLSFRKDDVIYAKDMKIKGQIENATFKAESMPFGAVQVKLVDMRRLRSLAVTEPDDDKLTALPDPGAMHNYANQVGTKLAFTVTGNPNAGGIWGANPYTLDSTLAMAAVHAGALKPGQTGVVKVEIVQSPPAFPAVVQNGVASNPWGPYPGGAYRFIIKPPSRD